MRPPPLLLLLMLMLMMLSPAVAGTCVVRPGEDLQGAIERAAAAGHESCTLAPGVFTVDRPVALPSSFALVGAGAGATVVRSVIEPPRSSGSSQHPGWPQFVLAPGVAAHPLLSTFFSNGTRGVRLSGLTIDGGLNATQRVFANTACGEGTGSDAVDPGYNVCRFLQFGLLLQSVADAVVDNVVIVNASRGLYVHGGAGLMLSHSVFAGNGFGSQTGDTVSTSVNVSITNTSFEGSLGHGLWIDRSSVQLREVRTLNNSWHGLRVTNSTAVEIDDLDSIGNGKCGIELAAVSGFKLTGGTIVHNACTGQGGLCIAGPHTRDGSVSRVSIVGNGGNIVGAEAENLTFSDVLCDMVLYKGKAWALDCEDCRVHNVSCHNGTTSDTSMRTQLAASYHSVGDDRRGATSVQLGASSSSSSSSGGQMVADAAAVATSSSSAGNGECVIQPGESIQPKINALVSAAGGGCGKRPF
jgi:hypothetical protein